jgi:hypothetical protein
MFVAAHKHELVDELFKILEELPDDWWQVRGCKNWLRFAKAQYANNPERFKESLMSYASSQDWVSGKSFEKVLDADL